MPVTCLTRAAVLTSLALTLALVACSGNAETVSVGVSESGRAVIAFEYDPEISAEDRALIEETIAESRRFYAAELGYDLKLDITVHVRNIDGGNLGGLSYGRTAWILTGGENWQPGSNATNVLAKQYIVAHELFHNFQSDLMYTDDSIPDDNPWWMVEGSADYAAYKFLSDYRRRDWNTTLLNTLVSSLASSGHRLPGLESSVRNLEDFSASYVVAVLAIDSLMQDQPMSVLGSYFSATGRMDWEEAFEQVFARDPAIFIQDYEARFQ